MADIGPAFEAVARRREAKAKAAEEADRKVTARDNYFMAAVHWARRSGLTTRTTKPTSPTTTRSGNATRNTPRSPIIASSQC